MIRLKPELFADLNGTVEGLRCALQNAIELEHSTIPTYLYALYSLKPECNLEIASVIKSIVLEEMLHMAIACNVMNAIGGSPDIDDPCFIPRYPGPLPGGVEENLTVPLSPFSKQLVKDVFMVIESPEDPLNFPVRRMDSIAGDADQPLTIGMFYGGIIQQLQQLGNGIFVNDPAKQVTTGFPALQTMNIHDVDSAVAAITLIVEQGEGTSKSPLDPNSELAHYYRFAEIYHGRALIANPDTAPGAPDFSYAGHRIHFDPAGVWPVISNPSPASYAPRSRVALLNDSFNATYSNVLRSLHRVFNGEPDWLGPAINSMESMKELALVMMSTEVVPGQTAGPTFEYTPAATGARA